MPVVVGSEGFLGAHHCVNALRGWGATALTVVTGWFSRVEACNANSAQASWRGFSTYRGVAVGKM